MISIVLWNPFSIPRSLNWIGRSVISKCPNIYEYPWWHRLMRRIFHHWQHADTQWRCIWIAVEPFKCSRCQLVLKRVFRVALLHLHRSFFAKAVIDHPEHPLKSPYAPSFLAAYRSALSIVKSVMGLTKVCPIGLRRNWMFWKHIFGSLVCRTFSSFLFSFS